MRTSHPETLDGLLLVNKPGGMTSHDVVNHVRRQFSIKKVGHCGTLDPMATGLLMLLLGKATKIQDLLLSEDKVYEGVLKLGETTNTQDADGEVKESKPVPVLTNEKIEEAFDHFLGDFYQTPPMVSAIKKDGVPLYKLARKGEEVDRPPRLMHVYRYDILDINVPTIRFKVKCTKGFYVRTYCHDIGEKIGCGGHLAELIRHRSGNFKLEDAVSWEALTENSSPSFLANHVILLPEISRIRRQ